MAVRGEVQWPPVGSFTWPPSVERARAATRRLVAGTPEDLVVFDGAGYRRELGGLLGRVSEVVRATFAGDRVDRKAADLIGTKLRGVDLREPSRRLPHRGRSAREPIFSEQT